MIWYCQYTLDYRGGGFGYDSGGGDVGGGDAGGGSDVSVGNTGVAGGDGCRGGGDVKSYAEMPLIFSGIEAGQFHVNLHTFSDCVRNLPNNYLISSVSQ